MVVLENSIKTSLGLAAAGAPPNLAGNQVYEPEGRGFLSSYIAPYYLAGVRYFFDQLKTHASSFKGQDEHNGFEPLYMYKSHPEADDTSKLGNI